MTFRQLIHNWVFQGICLGIGVSLLFAVMTGCSSSSSTHHSIASRISCVAQYHHWSNTGNGKAAIISIKDQIGPVTQAIKAHKRGELKRLASTFQEDTNTLRHNMPPNCIPNANAALQKLLTDANTSISLSENNKDQAAEQELKKAAKDAGQWAKALEAYIH